MPTFKIDNVAMTIQPTHFSIIPPEHQVYPLAGANKIVVQPLIPPRIEVRWGQEGQAAAIIAELKLKRGRDLVHAISWTDEENVRLKHCNVFFPEIPSAYSDPMRKVVEPVTLTLEAINPMPGLAIVELFRPGVLTVADGVAKWKTPAGGRVMKVRGEIGTLGTGAGQTRVQVSNGATDYLSTRGDFIVASGTNLMENQVLVALPTANRGETIELDVDTIPAGADSADLSVLLYYLMFEA